MRSCDVAIIWPWLIGHLCFLNGHKFPRYSHDIQTQIGQYGFGRIIFFREKYSGKKITNQFQKLWLATDQIFKNGCSPTNFKKMVGHQPKFEKWLLTDQFQKERVGHQPKFEKWLLTNQFQKLWLATDQNFENGCSPTNFKNFGWPPTKFNLISVHTCKLAKISVHMFKNSWK